ncbi:MAG: FAD-dependent oxidoreductase [Coriobacteriales bacterium]|jgi:thioredoxin reductase (NADPH)|nr:FAD-dependent oxidoreductase [Coriobacteriales bacterium]
MQPTVDSDRIFDVIVVGGGPAGITAALYLARARYRVLVVEKEEFGGQIRITDEVANYPGAGLTSGRELTATMQQQAEAFGAEFVLAEVTGLELAGDLRTAHTNRGDYQAFGLVIATGAHPRQVGFKGESEFKGRGVAYCATCDGEFFSGLDIFVVGGGLAAAEEAMFLTRFARKVTMLVRKDQLRAPQSVVEKVLADPNIEVRFNCTVEEVAGDSQLRLLRWRDHAADTVQEYRPPDGEGFGVFVFAGYEPSTGLLQGLVELDEAGYVVTDANRKSSVDGVYAAGDVCIKNLRQVVTATADGAIAATELERWAAAAQARTGIVPQKPPATPAGNVAASGVTPAAVVPGSNVPGSNVPGGNVPGGGTPISGIAGSGGGTPVSDTAGTATSGDTTATAANPTSIGQLFDAEMRAQLDTVFSRMQQPVILQAVLDDSPAAAELQAFLQELAGLSDKLSLNTQTISAALPNAASEEASGAEPPTAPESPRATRRPPTTPQLQGPLGAPNLPYVELLRADGQSGNLRFHGVPGGHETTSFILGIYNISGPGQPLDEGLAAEIAAISQPTALSVLVSLSCTNCPDVVQAAQRIAALNPLVSAAAYDLRLYPELKQHYNVMSVPCLIINQSGRPEQISFGKKQLPQLLELLR